MELFILIQDGKPIDHPIMGDNFRQAYPDVDLNNLPDWCARFERIEAPVCGIYEIYEGVTYEWDENIVKDVHHVRQMTVDEKTEKQNKAKEVFQKIAGWPSWVFNEETCWFDPPIPCPVDENRYFWDEPTLSWQKVLS